MTLSSPSRPPKVPHLILPNLYRFPPSRDILGGTAYFIVSSHGNIVVDCPAWESENQEFLKEQGSLAGIFITHRGAISKHIGAMQTALDCPIFIQEQEAYLLPGLRVTTFHERYQLTNDLRAVWTPGHSPGSACLYDRREGGILFSGRHLLPDHQGNPRPLRLAKTFHWPRQLRSVEALRTEFTPETLRYLCPGANVGFLRGRSTIDGAYSYFKPE